MRTDQLVAYVTLLVAGVLLIVGGIVGFGDARGVALVCIIAGVTLIALARAYRAKHRAP